jgi:hypothetical protein
MQLGDCFVMRCDIRYAESEHCASDVSSTFDGGLESTGEVVTTGREGRYSTFGVLVWPKASENVKLVMVLGEFI